MEETPVANLTGENHGDVMKTSENDSLTVYRIWMDFWGFQMIKNPMAIPKMGCLILRTTKFAPW
jgi:hypothetical protein